MQKRKDIYEPKILGRGSRVKPRVIPKRYTWEPYCAVVALMIIVPVSMQLYKNSQNVSMLDQMVELPPPPVTKAKPVPTTEALTFIIEDTTTTQNVTCWENSKNEVFCKSYLEGTQGKGLHNLSLDKNKTYTWKSREKTFSLSGYPMKEDGTPLQLISIK